MSEVQSQASAKAEGHSSHAGERSAPENPSSILPPVRGHRLKPSPTERWNRAIQVLSDSWLIEILASCLCLSCMIAISVTLMVFNDKPIPTLPNGLTLNAILAFISTIAKSSLLLVVSSCISQLKWRHYQTNRELEHTQIFEDASRGPLGSLRMLYNRRAWSSACVGALILIVALLFDPFVQQILTYPSVSSSTPSNLAVARQARAFFPDAWSSSGSPPASFIGAVSSGLWPTGFDPVPSCPTGDCTWDMFTSMGLCSSCGTANLSPRIECDPLDFDFPATLESDPNLGHDQRLCNVTFRTDRVFSVQINSTIAFRENYGFVPGTQYHPVGFYIWGPYGKIFPLYGLDFIDPRNDTIQGITNPLLTFAVVQFELSNSTLSIASAEECVAYFCLRDYTMSVENSIPDTKISNVRSGAGVWISTTNDLSAYCWQPQGETFVPTKEDEDDSWLLAIFHPDHFAFCADPFSLLTIWGKQLVNPFWANVTQGIGVGCPELFNTTKECSQHSGGGEALYAIIGDQTKQASVEQLYTAGATTVMSNIAASLTLLMMNDINSTNISGNIVIQVTQAHTRWVWLSLPMALVLAGMAFFSWTVLDTQRHKVPLWKGSILALIFHGLEEDELKGRIVAESVSGMEAAAADMTVLLRKTEADGRTVFARASGAETGTDHEMATLVARQHRRDEG